VCNISEFQTFMIFETAQCWCHFKQAEVVCVIICVGVSSNAIMQTHSQQRVLESEQTSMAFITQGPFLTSYALCTSFIELLT